MKQFILLFLYFSYHFLYAQDAGKPVRLNAVNTIIEGYNQQDFMMMQKPFFWLGRVLITEKMLKKEFAPFFNRLGKAKIDTIIISSKYDYVVKLKMEKDANERVYFKLFFGDNGKLQGFGFAYPPMIYHKAKIPGSSIEMMQARIDTVVRKKYSKKFNGCIFVLDSGKQVYKKCFGYADYKSKSTLNDSSLFELASCSKQFTAMGIIQLEEQGKLKYSDTLEKYFPGFPYPGICIENLLTHTSGLPDYEELLDKKWDKKKFATNKDVLETLKKYHPKRYFMAGERFEYSNLGYVLLSMIIEQTSGMSYAAFLDSAIFKPAGMAHTRVYNTRRWKNELLENYAYGYVYSSKQGRYILPDSLPEYGQVIYQDPITGDGTVNSCITDLALWDKALYENKFVTKANLDRAYTNYKLKSGEKINYGYGEFLREGENSERLIYHTGGWPGYATIIMRFVDQHKAVIILSNNEYGSFTRMADDIAAILVDDME